MAALGVTGRTSSESGTSAPLLPWTLTASSSLAPERWAGSRRSTTGTGSLARGSARCAASAPARATGESGRSPRRDAGARRLLAVDLEIEPRSGAFDEPVDVDDARGALEDRLHLSGEIQALLGGGRVDLGHQGREHRRSRGTSVTLTLAPWRAAIGRGSGAGSWRTDGWRRAVVLGQEVHLQVGDQRSGAQEVVPHQAVEVERRRGSDVGLDVGHLRQAAQSERELACDRGGVLERRPSGMSTTTWSSLLLSCAASSPPRCAAERAPSRRAGAPRRRQQREAARPAREERPEEPLVEAMERPPAASRDERVRQIASRRELLLGELRACFLKRR